MIPNTHKVPAALWKKFGSDKAKKVYNDIMKQSLPNQEATIHPDTKKLSKEHWETICHNMACYAAWAIDDDPMEKGDLIETENSKGDVVKKTKAK